MENLEALRAILAKDEITAEDRLTLNQNLQDLNAAVTAEKARALELDNALAEQKEITHRMYLKQSGSDNTVDDHKQLESAFEAYADTKKISDPDDAFATLIGELK